MRLNATDNQLRLQAFEDEAALRRNLCFTGDAFSDMIAFTRGYLQDRVYTHLKLESR